VNWSALTVTGLGHGYVVYRYDLCFVIKVKGFDSPRSPHARLVERKTHRAQNAASERAYRFESDVEYHMRL
jgi:hypothetical protein